MKGVDTLATPRGADNSEAESRLGVENSSKGGDPQKFKASKKRKLVLKALIQSKSEVNFSSFFLLQMNWK